MLKIVATLNQTSSYPSYEIAICALPNSETGLRFFYPSGEVYDMPGMTISDLESMENVTLSDPIIGERMKDGYLVYAENKSKRFLIDVPKKPLN